MASLPLRLDDEPAFGALDLYASSVDLSSTLNLSSVARAVAAPIAAMLSGAFHQLYEEEFAVPDWLTEDPAVGRLAVWTAVGMLVNASGQTDADALATLRAWAYSCGRSIDDVAASLTDREIPVESLLTGA